MAKNPQKIRRRDWRFRGLSELQNPASQGLSATLRTGPCGSPKLLSYLLLRISQKRESRDLLDHQSGRLGHSGHDHLRSRAAQSRAGWAHSLAAAGIAARHHLVVARHLRRGADCQPRGSDLLVRPAVIADVSRFSSNAEARHWVLACIGLVLRPDDGALSRHRLGSAEAWRRHLAHRQEGIVRLEIPLYGLNVLAHRAWTDVA